jgi:hypothetical protein
MVMALIAPTVVPNGFEVIELQVHCVVPLNVADALVKLTPPITSVVQVGDATVLATVKVTILVSTHHMPFMVFVPHAVGAMLPPKTPLKP